MLSTERSVSFSIVYKAISFLQKVLQNTSSLNLRVYNLPNDNDSIDYIMHQPFYINDKYKNNKISTKSKL